jgi:hypothetical protein
METIPEMKIEGLEEALERFRALSGEIDRLTESARTATTFVRDLHEQLGLSVLEPSGDSPLKRRGCTCSHRTQLRGPDLHRDHDELGPFARRAR